MQAEENASVVSEDISDMDMWHQRLDHLNSQHLRVLVHGQLVCSVMIPEASTLSFCAGCIEVKIQLSYLSHLCIMYEH